RRPGGLLGTRRRGGQGRGRSRRAALIMSAHECLARIEKGAHPMLYMVVERYKDERAVDVYRRARDRGRMMPEGLRYLSSWVDLDYSTCFQLMETDDV